MLDGPIVVALLESLSAYDQLQVIELRQCNLQVRDALVIVQALARVLPSVRRLDLSNNAIPVCAEAEIQPCAPTTLTVQF